MRGASAALPPGAAGEPPRAGDLELGKSIGAAAHGFGGFAGFAGFPGHTPLPKLVQPFPLASPHNSESAGPGGKKPGPLVWELGNPVNSPSSVLLQASRSPSHSLLSWSVPVAPVQNASLRQHSSNTSPRFRSGSEVG